MLVVLRVKKIPPILRRDFFLYIKKLITTVENFNYFNLIQFPNFISNEGKQRNICPFAFN